MLVISAIGCALSHAIYNIVLSPLAALRATGLKSWEIPVYGRIFIDLFLKIAYSPRIIGPANNSRITFHSVALLCN